ncbi:hypothetical protein [Vibrio crassostreae]|uniref:hypothetical protein n=1 Tax=Vibrio crassostreae TaxID=246167 RepID=UPI001B311F46|nr:hypothetical protein [Vibrio crassostreae]
MLTRINFNSVSANELKHTVGSSINLINSLFFFSFFVKGTHSTPNVEEIIPLKPFKPSRKRVYSKFAEILGYKNWDELWKVSQDNTFDDIETVFIHQQPTLCRSISKLFQQLLEEQYELPKSGKLHGAFTYAAYRVAAVVTDAVILNTNKSEKMLAHYGYDETADPLSQFAMITGYHDVLPTIIGMPTVPDVYGFANYFKYEVSNLATHLQDITSTTNVHGDCFNDDVVLNIFRLAENYRPRTLENGYEFVGSINMLQLGKTFADRLQLPLDKANELLLKPMSKELMLEMLIKHKGNDYVVFNAGRPLMLFGDIINESDDDGDYY